VQVELQERGRARPTCTVQCGCRHIQGRFGGHSLFQADKMISAKQQNQIESTLTQRHRAVIKDGCCVRLGGYVSLDRAVKYLKRRTGQARLFSTLKLRRQYPNRKLRKKRQRKKL